MASDASTPGRADRIKLAHGSFDNDIEGESAILERMRGAPLAARVENPTY